VNASARKQANLARVLALEPELVLLDDPLEGLDAADRARAEELIQVWATDVSCTLVIAVEGADSFSQLEAARLQLDQTPMPAELP
jgi:ABC-type transporter Mla maintaining outer membrane lipid asymmetry ATPase subunit MlaF